MSNHLSIYFFKTVMCIFFHLIIQNEHLENNRYYVLRSAWVQNKHSTFSCHDRETQRALSVASESTLFGGGWMWTGQTDVCADGPAGNQAGCFFFCLFPSSLSSAFSPFLEASTAEEQGWSIDDAKEGREGTASWEWLERLPFIGMLGPLVLLIRIQCHTRAGLVLLVLVFSLRYSALRSPPLLVVLPAAG